MSDKYVVINHDEEGLESIVGVFNTLKKAKQYIVNEYKLIVWGGDEQLEQRQGMYARVAISGYFTIHKVGSKT